MEKTAMQELLATFLSEWAEPTEVWYPEKVINRVERMLDKERQQIEIAWIDGKENQSFGDNIEDDASKYFTKKYGQ